MSADEQYRAGFEAWADKPIFLVSAHWDHEGSSPIKAFADKADADALSAYCHEYHQTKPRCPEIGTTPENDAEWAAWQVENDKWEKGHPAGEGQTTCDSFFVTEIPLASKSEASTEPSAIPDVLFDGSAVYDEIVRVNGHRPDYVVSDTLDAVVRLMRKAGADNGSADDAKDAALRELDELASGMGYESVRAALLGMEKENDRQEREIVGLLGRLEAR